MQQEKILIIGAGGQIGVELTLALRQLYGNDHVIATDIRDEHPLMKGTGPYAMLNAMEAHAILSDRKRGHYTDIPAGSAAVGNR